MKVGLRRLGELALPAAAAVILCASGCEREPEAPPTRAGDLPDFAAIRPTAEKKKRFIEYLRPLIEEENGRILLQRRRLLRLLDAHQEEGVISWADMRWLEGLLREYRVEGLTVGDFSYWDNLLRRVDIVPLDLAVIQAAKESGWGSSRFAREGNNLFGERCFVRGCGLVPGDRAPGETHEVATFPTVRDSVRSYIRNLNTNGAYRRFRRLRFRQRAEGREPDGLSLVEGLPQYSERRYLYLDEIRAMIRVNRRFLDS